MKLVLIPPGEFVMGSPKEVIEQEMKRIIGDDSHSKGLREIRASQGPQHPVRITRPFFMGITLVTQAEYQRVIGQNPSVFSLSGGSKSIVATEDTRRFPVENVYWSEAAEFCRKLSELPEEKRTARKWRYSLPTEAQWEYACRAGNPGRWWFSPQPDNLSEAEADKLMGECRRLRSRTYPVCERKPNPWGLYDLYGFGQLCEDWYEKDYYSNSPHNDPVGPQGDGTRADRGGIIWAGIDESSSAYREPCPLSWRYQGIGFRVVLVPADRPSK